MSEIFGELDSRLSVVKRWNLLHTIQSQTVAEHAFNVTRIAERIAERWFGVKPDSVAMNAVLRHAHHHDDFEALSLDLPTMVKPYFDELSFEADHADLIKVENPAVEVYRIVKLADMLEGWHFLCIEAQMGNAYAWDHYDYEPARILNWFEQTFRMDCAYPVDWYDTVRNELCCTIEGMRKEKSSRFSRRGA